MSNHAGRRNPWHLKLSLNGFCVCVLLLILQSCSAPEALSLAALRPAYSEVEGATSLQVKSVVDVREYPADTDVLSVRALRQQQVVESGYFKYHLPGDPGRAYKLKMIIYESAQVCAKAWAHQYPAFIREAGRPRDWGDDGFEVPERMAAFRLGRLSVQVDAVGGGLDPVVLAEQVLARARRLRQ